jgi:nitrogen regulatory protein P-II 2
MKMIVAVIKPSKLEEVRTALSVLGIAGMTVSEVKGFGRQGGHTEIYRGAEYEINFVPKIKVEIAVGDDLADRAVDSIRNAANTDRIGDGKIFVFDLSQAVRIRTGETDAEAL